MAIVKRPSSKRPADADKSITGAAAATTAPATAAAKGRVATMVRFDAALLEKVDAAAKKRGISRSAWIQYTLSEALEAAR